MHTPRTAGLMLLLAGFSTACDQAEQPAAPPTPPPTVGTPPAPPAAAPGTPGLPDPLEPGISDTARVSRYVYREINVGGCAVDNPYQQSLMYNLQVQITGSKIASVELTEAGLVVADPTKPTPLTKEHWPSFDAFLGCLKPRLEGLTIEPAVADETYPAGFMRPGAPGGKPSP